MLKALWKFRKINSLLFPDEEYEAEDHEGGGDDLDAPPDEREIENYCG